MALPFLLCAFLMEAPAPRPWVACTLELHGTLNTRRPHPRGTETVSETFQYVLPGWLQELESPSGSVVFEFQPNRAQSPAGILNLHAVLRGKQVKEEHRFFGSEFSEPGSFRFRAHLRGQNLYPEGDLKITGTHSAGESGPSRVERRTVSTTPFPAIRRGPRDFAAPTLRFTMSSLWRLHRAPEPFAVNATVTYANNAGGVSYAGRVDLRFRLDPRQRAEHP
ncbi:MAG: hypothetical protein HY823_09965 [Acidobacteria bacterium]|nr:hypothetical protein [Acidobacteriota bacterium]